MDPTNFLPVIAGWLHIAPSQLLLYIGMVISISTFITKLIPNDATGWLGVVRKIAAVPALYVRDRVTAGVTVADVAAASMATPPIPQKVEAAAESAAAAPSIPQTTPIGANQP